MMARFLGSKGRRLLGVVVAIGAAIGAVAGYAYGVAQTTNQTYTGCLLRSGDLKSVQIGGTPLRTCPPDATTISWSETGPQGVPGTDGKDGKDGTNGTNGANGISVTSTALAVGDPNCPYGGTKLTAADNTVTYACNGAPGQKGDPGTPGGGGPLAYAYVDHGSLDASRSFGVNHMTLTLVPGGAGDIYCFDLVGIPLNIEVNRALGSGNTGGAGGTVSGTPFMGTLPCAAPYTDAAVVSGVNGTSSFFVLFN
jgi:hypothetical protein